MFKSMDLVPRLISILTAETNNFLLQNLSRLHLRLFFDIKIVNTVKVGGMMSDKTHQQKVDKQTERILASGEGSARTSRPKARLIKLLGQGLVGGTVGSFRSALKAGRRLFQPRTRRQKPEPTWFERTLGFDLKKFAKMVTSVPRRGMLGLPLPPSHQLSAKQLIRECRKLGL